MTNAVYPCENCLHQHINQGGRIIRNAASAGNTGIILPLAKAGGNPSAASVTGTKPSHTAARGG